MPILFAKRSIEAQVLFVNRSLERLYYRLRSTEHGRTDTFDWAVLRNRVDYSIDEATRYSERSWAQLRNDILIQLTSAEYDNQGLLTNFEVDAAIQPHLADSLKEYWLAALKAPYNPPTIKDRFPSRRLR